MTATSTARWYRDPSSRHLIFVGYLPWLAGLNLLWEIGHISLYTLWNEAEPAYIASAVVHCTLGDIMIGSMALLLALILTRARASTHWRWRTIAAITALLGAGYTIFSEWMNISVLRSWNYSDSMPTLSLGAFELGLTPLAQWLILPPLALALAKRTCV